jgi:hypothetical protein
MEYTGEPFFLFFSCFMVLVGFVIGILTGLYWRSINVVDEKNLKMELESDEEN